jgi:hypothetical protein
MKLTKFQEENLSPEEKEFIWREMLRPVKFTKKKAAKLIDQYEEQIQDFRSRLKSIPNRIEKNMIYTRIQNRETIIKKINEYL